MTGTMVREGRLLLSSNLGSLGSCFLGRTEETPLKGTPLNPPCGSLKRDLIERVYMPKGPLILTPIVKEYILSYHNRNLEKLPWILD